LNVCHRLACGNVTCCCILRHQSHKQACDDVMICLGGTWWRNHVACACQATCPPAWALIVTFDIQPSSRWQQEHCLDSILSQLIRPLQDGGQRRLKKGQIPAQPKNFVIRQPAQGGPGRPGGTISQIKHTTGIVSCQAYLLPRAEKLAVLHDTPHRCGHVRTHRVQYHAQCSCPRSLHNGEHPPGCYAN